MPLAQRGCEIIQVDQVVGGSFPPPCYNPAHPHPPGPGLWQTESFARQLETMRAAMRKSQPDAVVCYEEPNEWFNHLAGIQDYRDCEAPYEWASVFNYLYHEFLPTFQSNERPGDLVVAAHCLVDGQIPHLVPSGQDLGGLLLVNGGFEPLSGVHGTAVGWEQVHGYQGKSWTGVAVSDAVEKHGGAASIRLDNATPGDTVQVSQNVNVGMGGLVPGKQYRLAHGSRPTTWPSPTALILAFSPQAQNQPATAAVWLFPPPAPVGEMRPPISPCPLTQRSFGS